MADLETDVANFESDRLMSDATRRTTHPRRMDFPISAREATVADSEASPSPPGKRSVSPDAAPPLDAMSPTHATAVRDILDAIDSVGDSLYTFTTPEERVRIRQATCAPRSTVEWTIHTNPTSSLLSTSLLAIGAGVFIGSMISRPSFSQGNVLRGISSTSQRTVDRMLEYA